MSRSPKATAGAIALALGSMALLCASDGADRVVTASAKAAKQAAKALDHHKPFAAVAAAERAVALAPHDAGYRLLLGQSYLKAGRFASAGQAFADTLQLDAGNGRAALNLALTQLARGDWHAAHATLDAHAGDIPAADRGLALALAGDTTGAVTLLTQVARSAAGNATVRQNLALAYAMAGQWNIARIIAAADMSPADVDARMQQWAAFVQPQTASDQVAGLLGVRPVTDAGLPAALALNAPTSTPARAAQVVVVQDVPPARPLTAVAATPVTPVAPKMIFAERREVVQPLPVAAVAALPVNARHGAAVRGAAKPAAGPWYVQLGAFDTAQEVKAAWQRVTRLYASFSGFTPQGTKVKTAKAVSYRLSVGGFTRAGADSSCRRYRARGGACFVRLGAGEQMASRGKANPVQVASR